MTTRPRGITLAAFDMLGAVSTEDMGPRGSDITAAFAAALLAGTPVFVPFGSWYISQLTLPANSTIIGMGPGSVLKAKAGANATTMTVGSNCYIDGFTVDGNKNAQAGGGFNCIEIAGAQNVTINDVVAKDARGSGFVVSGGCDGLAINTCTATGYTESGFKFINGTNISVINPRAIDSDPAATGDGIAITSDGATVSNIHLVDPIADNVNGRGIALIGNGSRNVTDILITGPQVFKTTSHGIHMMSADSITIQGGYAKSCSGDGIRVEGDVLNSRVFSMQVKSNLGTAIREIVSGSTPNYNGLIYNVVANNGSNAITKVGANSFIV
jgi:hypothetical protein